jgi:AraC-like DNA-binding protein
MANDSHSPTANLDDYPRADIYRQVVRAKLYLDVHFAEPIDLGNIAIEAFYSRHHFLRLFKSMYGTTPQQYRKRLRIERAKALLAEGHGVTDVCFDVGFESLSTFSATFKAMVGVPPSRFRRDAGLRRNSIQQQPLAHVPACYLENFEGVQKQS